MVHPENRIFRTPYTPDSLKVISFNISKLFNTHQYGSDSIIVFGLPVLAQCYREAAILVMGSWVSKDHDDLPDFEVEHATPDG
jgi:hypothetical protein